MLTPVPKPLGPICLFRGTKWIFYSPSLLFCLQVCQLQTKRRLFNDHLAPTSGTNSGFSSSLRRMFSRFLLKLVHSPKTKWVCPPHTVPKISILIFFLKHLPRWLHERYWLHPLQEAQYRDNLKSTKIPD